MDKKIREEILAKYKKADKEYYAKYLYVRKINAHGVVVHYPGDTPGMWQSYNDKKQIYISVNGRLHRATLTPM
jgi:hypothetical protein